MSTLYRLKLHEELDVDSFISKLKEKFDTLVVDNNKGIEFFFILTKNQHMVLIYTLLMVIMRL